MLEAVGKRLVEYRWLDGLLVAVIVGVHITVVWTSGRFDAMRTTGFANRLSLYTDMITVTGLLFGFAATALASYLAFSGQQIVNFRALIGGRVLGQWMSAIGGFAVTLVVLILCKVLDRDAAAIATAGTAAEGMRWVAEGALIFAALRLIRLLWVFREIVLVATAPPARRRRREQPIGVRTSV